MCGKYTPDLIIISLSLPEEAAFTLFRLIRQNVKTSTLRSSPSW